jgi:hypothetical protein
MSASFAHLAVFVIAALAVASPVTAVPNLSSKSNSPRTLLCIPGTPWLTLSPSTASQPTLSLRYLQPQWLLALRQVPRGLLQA